VQLGDELNGWNESATVPTFAEAIEWLRDAAIGHFPDSGFARKYGVGFVRGLATPSTASAPRSPPRSAGR
jgi:hypothetical protein